MPRKKDEHLHAQRQKEILEAAKKCFVANGFHKSSMRQILDAAGISSGGAYNYFASKADIVKALIEEERADFHQLLQHLESSSQPLTAIAEAVFEIIASYDHNDAVLAAEIWAEACRNPEIKQLERAMSDEFKNILKECLAKGIQDGDITKLFSIEDLAEWIMALVEGYLGRIAVNADLDSKHLARIAKLSVQKLLEKTQ